MNDASAITAAPADIPAAELAATNVPLTILALAMGGFAIGTTEFAAMSLLPYFAAGLGVSEPRRPMRSAPMRSASSSARPSSRWRRRGCRANSS
jgi:hypothetical protein